MIPFINLVKQRKTYQIELENAERRVLDSGCFIGGPEVFNFEKELSDYLGGTFALTCGSGTSALIIALKTLDLKPGDQVIVPDFTFIAPAETVAFLGAVPIFADIDPETLQISPESVASLITPKTKGIIAVNLFGQCAPYKQLKTIAQQNNLWIIEDSAQAFGATQIQNYNDKIAAKACTFGDISITSFYPAKPLGCYGDGGALFSPNEVLLEKARIISAHGAVGRYHHQVVGLNSRLDAIQAAILRVKLSHFNSELKQRQINASYYNHFFNSLNTNPALYIKPQKIAENNFSTFAQYTILTNNRSDFIQKLTDAQIPYCVHYPTPLHLQECFKNLVGETAKILKKSEICPYSTKASQQVLSLPFCAFTDVKSIIKKMENFLK